jgi:hypothetical protein
MSDLKETKSLVAKLMAEENLDVQHGKYDTAMFDLKNRKLLLPVYKWMDGPVYDLMCSHEVGHARYTPEDGWHQTPSDKGAGYKSFVNVVEDARIEKKIKRKFPGAGRQMIDGYEKLLKENFFGVRGKDLRELKLIDRINLYTKCGTDLDIKFSEEEREYVEMVERTETFDEVLDVVEKLWNYSKENESDTDQHQDFEDSFGEEYGDDSSDPSERLEGNDDSMEMDSDDNESSESNYSSPGDNEKSEESDKSSDGKSEESESSEGNSPADKFKNDFENKDDSETQESEKMQIGPKGGFGTPDEGITDASKVEPYSYTDNEWEKNQSDLLVESEKSYDFLYLNEPTFNLKNYIIDFTEVLSHIEEQTNDSGGTFYGSDCNGWGESGESEKLLNDEWKEFRTKHSKVINYLAKEFEMKKAAGQHARAMTAKTGIIDSGNLFKYRYSEDIFKKMTVLPDGKNHGLLLFIDWSGSMSNCIYETVEQCLVLAAFCEKVQISFEVFMFSDSYGRRNRNRDERGFGDRAQYNSEEYIKERIINPKKGDLFTGDFHLLNILSSRMNKRNFQKGAKYFLGLGKSIGNRYGYNQFGPQLRCPISFGLGGTPLDDAIIVTPSIVTQFKKETGAEIVNAVYLTDGDSRQSQQWIDYNDEMVDTGNNYNDSRTNAYYGKFHVNGYSPAGRGARYSYGGRQRVFIKCKNGKSFDLEESMTPNLLKYVKASTGINVLGIFLAPPRYWKHRGYWDFENKDLQNYQESFKKGSVGIEGAHGYDERYFINIDKMRKIQDTNLKGLSEDATKGQIKNAFKKMVGNRLSNRVILNSMIDKIAV